MGEPFAPTCAEVIDLIGKFYEIELDLPNPHNLTGVEQETALARILAARTSVLVWSRGRPVMITCRRHMATLREYFDTDFRHTQSVTRSFA
jgi:hypothetical protein